MKSLFSLFEKRLFNVSTSDRLFNQYSSLDGLVDREEAPAIRRQNLRNYLRSFPDKPSILVLCEAPGPWGCRFSGVPITGENQLLSGLLPFSGQQSSLGEPLLMIKKKPPFREYSAGIFWETLSRFHPRFLVWNAVPLHPHSPENILSIRTPLQREILMFIELLENICDYLSAVHYIAIGRKAEFAFSRLGIKPEYVRHPAQGGAALFRESVTNVMMRFCVRD